MKKTVYFGPVEALSYALTTALVVDGSKKPGWVIERMSPDVRAQLKQLTSDHTRNMRV